MLCKYNSIFITATISPEVSRDLSDVMEVMLDDVLTSGSVGEDIIVTLPLSSPSDIEAKRSRLSSIRFLFISSLNKSNCQILEELC